MAFSLVYHVLKKKMTLKYNTALKIQVPGNIHITDPSVPST